jgi:putative OmpL-like beta-barrel porin-2
MIKKFYLLFCLFSVFGLFAQTDPAEPDTIKKTHTVQFSGFIDAYYSYDFNKPPNHEISAPFIYNYKRDNEFNINLALLSASYSGDKIRSKIGLMAGTYAQYNYASEQGLLKNIYEANAGIKLMKHLWLDAGIFASHIGNESAYSLTNPTLTRSIMAENTPYYQTGAKLTYDAGKKWLFSLLLLNGWQNIQETPDNTNKPVCTQVLYRPNDKTEFNYSTFIGNEKPDSAKQWRYFNHVYFTSHFSKKIYLSTAFDYGIQQKFKDKAHYDKWFGTSLILKYKLTRKFSTSVRGEYYSDPSQVIVTTNTPYGTQVLGTSLNLDFSPYQGSLIRIEGKMYNAQNDIFLTKNGHDSQTYIVTVDFVVSF